MGLVHTGGTQPSRHFVVVGRPCGEIQIFRSRINLLVTSCSLDAQNCAKFARRRSNPLVTSCSSDAHAKFAHRRSNLLISSLRARRTPKTAVKCEVCTSAQQPSDFVTSCSSDAQNCGEMHTWTPGKPEIFGDQKKLVQPVLFLVFFGKPILALILKGEVQMSFSHALLHVLPSFPVFWLDFKLRIQTYTYCNSEVSHLNFF